MSPQFKIPRKLIEVALPLDAINKASAKEKSIRHGHPSTLHLWWARRPLAAARAVIFSQMVNDPGYERHLGRGVNKEKAQKERERLFRIIERLVDWDNSNNEALLAEAKEEILKSWRETCALNKDHPEAKLIFNPDELPALHDPFAGGGAIPFEAQRLGMKAFASDLNPVAVIINKAMIEVPPLFLNRKPIGPIPKGEKQKIVELDNGGSYGLAEDIRRYGLWMREQALDQIGHLYPSALVTREMVADQPKLKNFIGERLTPIAWIWARTVASPSPAFSHQHIPLLRSSWLSTKDGKETWIDFWPDSTNARGYSIRIKSSGGPSRDGTIDRGGAVCILSGAAVPFSYIRSEAKAGRMKYRLMAVVADSKMGRLFLPPTEEIENVAAMSKPRWKPDVMLPVKHRNFQTPAYGMTRVGDLFTDRQLVALDTLASLVSQVRAKVLADSSGEFDQDERSLDQGGRGSRAYADAVALYLGIAVSRSANTHNNLTVWSQGREQSVNLFSRQAIPMAWDFPEVNPFAEAAGDFSTTVTSMAKIVATFSSKVPGTALQLNASDQNLSDGKVVSTDPPYFDNVAYAELSDFFYVWMRRTLGDIFPLLFSKTEVPKKEELIASPTRHGGKEESEHFFLEGMTGALKKISTLAHPAYPITIYYAFKESETDSSGTSNTGWETFLEAVLKAGLMISGTWPMRTERPTGVKSKMNALASSIILVCNRRQSDAVVASRREFIRELNSVLPEAFFEMTTGGDHSPVAPVDLSQAIIGPGMAVFSKYAAVLEADGKPMSVKVALQLINRFLVEDDFDHDTQFCLRWVEQHGWESGQFGEADVLARAKGTSVEGLRESGIVASSGGTLRLLRASELPQHWKPEGDIRISVWELLHHMVARFELDGESGAAEILSRANLFNENIRTLAYRLYTLCERKNWTKEASQYDALVRAWDSIETATRAVGYSGTQISLFGMEQAEAHATPMKRKKTRTKK